MDGEAVEPRDCPYMGLDYYHEESAAWFFGRQADSSKIITNLQGARLTLLHAESGVGKSSLLRAGVAWRLRRLAHSQLPSGGELDIPVVFSSWKDEPVRALVDAIDTAIDPFLAGRARPRLPADRLDAAIGAASNAVDACLLIMLDQFEEYLLYRSREPAAERFVDELARCVNRADLPVNFLIAIREDAYAGLGDLFKGQIANFYGNYLHIEYLDQASAEQAIREPLKVYNRLPGVAEPIDIEDGLVDRVLKESRAADSNGAGRVAPPLLQLVMEAVWKRERAEGSRQLRLSTLTSLEGVGKIVDAHLGNALRALSENERETAIDIFESLVTPSGGKVAESVPYLAERTGHSEDQVGGVLGKLDHERIVRPVPPPPRRDPVRYRRYEIFHDVLARAITDVIAARQERRHRRRLQRYVAVGASVLIVALGVIAAFIILWQNASNQTRAAQSEQMAAEAMNLLPADGPLAMLLSLQAFERAHTLQAESAVIQAAQQPLDDLLVSGSLVRAVRFSPDGRILAAGGSSGDVGLWDVRTGRRIASLAQGGAVYGVAFSLGGKILAAGDVHGDVGLWDVATGRRVATFAEGNPVDCVAFSPDGRTLAVGDGSGQVGLWDVVTGRRTAMLAGGSQAASVAFSPDGRTLAVGDVVGHVSVWDVATGRQIVSLTEGGAVYGVAFSPGGRTLAAGDGSGHVGVWDVATWRRVATFAEGSPVAGVAFSPDGRTLAAGDYGGHVGVWNVAASRQTAVFAEGSPVYAVAFSPDGKTLAAGDLSGDVGVWDVAAGQSPASIDEGSPVYSVALSPDDRTLAVGDVGGYVGLWDVATGRRTAVLNEGNTVEAVAFSPDGKTLAAGDYSGYVGLWDVATGRRIAALDEGSFVAGVAFSPDGRTLAVGDSSGDVGLWDVATGQQTLGLGEGSRVDRVAFSPDGRTLAVGDYGGDVGLWDMATGGRTAILAEGGAVSGVAFSPDGRTLAVGDLTGHVGLWDVATGRQTAALAEGAAVESVAFSPDGPLATGDSLGNVGIWNAANGRRYANLAAGGAVTSLAFSPHGQVLAVGGLNGDVTLARENLTDLSQGLFTRLICGKVRENMTREQWTDYVPGQPYQKTCT
jgi:WD40 repeat protein